MQLFLWFLLIYCAYGHPVPETDPTTSNKCVFENGHLGYTNPLEKITRLGQSEVSKGCEGDVKKLLEYKSHGRELHGALDTAHLVFARAFGLYSGPTIDNFIETSYICTKHLNELSTDWSIAKYHHFKTFGQDRTPECSFPESIIPGLHNDRRYYVKKNMPQLSYGQAEFILRTNGVLLHPGIPVCNNHLNAIDKQMEQEKEKLEREKEKMELEKSIAEEEAKDPSFDPETCPAPIDDDQESEEHKKKSKAVKEFADALGLDRVVTKESFSSLQKSTQMKKIRTARKMISVISEVAAPECPRHFERLLQKDQLAIETEALNFQEELLKTISFEYDLAPNPTARIAILSLVSPYTPYSIIKQFIPTLSLSTFKRSKYYTSLEELKAKEGNINPRERYSAEAVYHFVRFLASPEITTELPTRSSTITLQSGEKIELANTIRNQNNAELIKTYQNLLVSEGNQHLKMSISTYNRILTSLPSTQSKAMQCVDYYVSDGEMGFDDLIKIVRELELLGKIQTDETKLVVQLLKEVKSYLMNNYRFGLKWKSDIIEQSIQFALNGKIGSEFYEEIEKPIYHCDECLKLKVVLDKMEALVKKASQNAESGHVQTFNVMKHRLESATSNIFEMRRHFVRVGHSIFAKDQFLEEIKKLPNEEMGLLTLDWAQKMLPQGYRESQKDYFGKRGMSYHVSHLQIHRENLPHYHYFVHLVDDSKQDWQAVAAILHDICVTLKTHTRVKQIVIRSDNAGCYKNTNLLASIPTISQQTGIQIVRFSFSESQHGKDASDRGAAIVKSKVKNWINNGHNVKTIAEMFEAITQKSLTSCIPSNCEAEEPATKKARAEGVPESELPAAIYTSKPGESLNLKQLSTQKDYIQHECPLAPQGMSVFQVVLTKITTTSNLKFEKITELSDFSFNNNKITVKKHYGIGIGKEYQTTNNQQLPTLTRSKQYLPIDFFSLTTKRGSRCVKSVEEEMEVEVDDDDFSLDSRHKLFECPSCHRRFLTETNLMNHMDYGKHNVKRPKEIISDAAAIYYSAAISEYNPVAKKIAADMIHRSGSLKDDEGQNLSVEELLEGWALSSRKRTAKFDDDQKAFMTSIFEEGEKTKVKKTPASVAEMMTKATKTDGSPRFTPSQFLSSQQISGFFGRLKSASEKAKQQTQASSSKVVEEEEVFDEEEEIETDSFANVDDEFFDSIQQKLPSIFEEKSNN